MSVMGLLERATSTKQARQELHAQVGCWTVKVYCWAEHAAHHWRVAAPTLEGAEQI